MFRAAHAFVGLLAVLLLLLVSSLESHQNGTRLLSRKRRFLLFPPGANFIVTISGGKGSMFETPRGYNLVAEMDMYHPLPDYLYHATSLRLGTVAAYPSDATPTVAPTTPRNLLEPSRQEVDQYLAQHPDTWVPTGWGNDRADWTVPKVESSTGSGIKYLRMQSPPTTYQSWKRKLWESTGSDRLYFANPSSKRARSLEDLTFEDEHSPWMEPDQLNISHHLGWEHFHHYRDRRSLFQHIESTIPSFFGFHMRECLLRSICEARNLLPPKGRSMTVDLLRVIFTYPLKDDLTDEYSEMLRMDAPDCRALFQDRCPLSILQLVLFGKFEA